MPEKVTKNISEDYKKLLVVNHHQLKYTFIGGFLSRVFYKRSFNTCYTAGSESVKRILELLRFGLEYPTDNNYEGEWKNDKKCGYGIMNWENEKVIL